MATIPRRTENTNYIATGTLYQPSCACYLVTVKNAGASAIDLRDEDAFSNADLDSNVNTPDTIAVGVVEAILREINPLAYFTTDTDAGTMMIIVDKGITAAELQVRIRNIGKDATPATTTSIGPNDVDISGTIVQDVAPTSALDVSGTVTFTAATSS